MYEHAVTLATNAAQVAFDRGEADTSSSVIKYASAKANQDRHELSIEILGLDGVGWSGSDFSAENLNETRKWLRSKGNSIEGGTSEINLNVIAKQILRLPDN